MPDLSGTTETLESLMADLRLRREAEERLGASIQRNVATMREVEQRIAAEIAARQEPLQHGPHVGIGRLGQADAAELILRQAGKPLRMPEIVEEMVRRGYPTGEGTEKQKRDRLRASTNTALLRQPERFYHPNRGFWDLVSRR